MSVQSLTPYFLTNSTFFMNASNIVTADWNNVSKAFVKPIATNSTPITGYNWSLPYPGTSLTGFNVNLTVSQELRLPQTTVENGTTIMSSLTFGTPAGLMIDMNQAKPMDKSWYICRHVFVSTKPAAKSWVDAGAKCGFLTKTCQDDLKSSLTKNWGKLDTTYMCSAMVFDSMPSSCTSSFGLARQDVMAFDSKFLANTTLGPAQASEQQQKYSWRMGTNYHNPGDARALASAASRTYLVATVWGYSSSARSTAKQVPDVTFACLSPKIPQAAPPKASSSTSVQTSAATSKASTAAPATTSKAK